MILAKEFVEAVNNKRKTKVRIMLKNSMLVDPSFKNFDNMLEYANNNMTDLYDLHNGEKLNNDSSAWDEDYMNQQMVAVVRNFSKERIELLKKIVQKLYGYKIQTDMKTKHDYNSENLSSSMFVDDKKQNTSRVKQDYTSNISSSTVFVNDKSQNKSKTTAGVVAIVGAGALIGGIVGSSTPMVVIGGIALVGGGTAAVLSRK